MNYGTSYVETELILAAQERDDATIERRALEMLPGERTALRNAASYLIDSLNSADRIESKRGANQQVSEDDR